MKRIAWFVGLTFLISWAAWVPVVLLGLHTTESVGGAVLFFVGGFGPSIVGAVFLLRSREPGRVRELLSRTFSFSRVPARILLLAVLVYPALFLAGSMINAGIGGSWPAFDGFAGLIESVPAFFGGVLLTFFLGPFSEEIGWRGYALPRLQEQHTPLFASLLLGFIWWAWHIPLFFMDGTLHATQGMLSAFSAGYLITVLSYSVLFTWLYNQTDRSISIAIIAHFAINMTISGGSPFDGTVFAILSFMLLGVCVVLVLVRPSLAYHVDETPAVGTPDAPASPGSRPSSTQSLGSVVEP
jgi:membrane protease YdiL (CAAX protease family)